MALTGLELARLQELDPLLFNRDARLIARSPARALINPQWDGHCQAVLGARLQIRHYA